MHRWKLSGTMGLAHGFHFHKKKPAKITLAGRISFYYWNLKWLTIACSISAKPEICSELRDTSSMELLIC